MVKEREVKKRGKSVERIEFPKGPKYLEDPLRDGPGKNQ